MSAVARWVWSSPAAAAVTTRVSLLPLAAGYRAVAAGRAAAARRGWITPRRLPGPTIGVGNLTVGGTGKTPLASWVAGWLVARGARPAILLRGYGESGDEAALHRRAVPEAVVVEGADRVASAGRAAAAGARAFVLDDGFQRLGVARDLDLVLISAESWPAPRWPLPAGPWREGTGALARAGIVVVTRKRASAEEAAAVAAQVAALAPQRRVARLHLRLSGLRRLSDGAVIPVEVLTGARVIAASGIADPDSFAAQLRGFGARVHTIAFPDHHRYASGDIDRLAAAAGTADHVVITEKDVAGVGARWAGAPSPLVAALSVDWEEGHGAVRRALEGTLGEWTRSP